MEEETAIRHQCNLDLFKERGDKLFNVKKFNGAIDWYGRAIELAKITSQNDHLSLCYDKRAQVYTALFSYKRALDDIEKCEELDENYKKSGHQRLHCLTMMGNMIAARNFISQHSDQPQPAESDSPWVKAVAEYEEIRSFLCRVDDCIKACDYRYALFYLQQLYNKEFRGDVYYVARGECLMELGEYADAEQEINYIFRENPTSTNPDALYVRGMCWYYLHSDELKIAEDILKRALRSDPDHKKARVWSKSISKLRNGWESAEERMRACSYDEAYQLYCSATDQAKSNKKLYHKLLLLQSQAAVKAGRTRDAVKDCTTLLGLDAKNIEALRCRAQCYELLEDWLKCLADADEIHSIEPTIENYLFKIKIRRMYNRQQQEILQRHGPCRTLGVASDASNDEIKRAYRKLSLKYHPDKNQGKSEADIARSAEMFKEITKAYRALNVS